MKSRKVFYTTFLCSGIWIAIGLSGCGDDDPTIVIPVKAIPTMADIPAGCFEMGDLRDSCNYDSNECPVHYVCISAFEMDLREVTNAEYAACVAAGGCTPPSNTSSNTRATYYGKRAYANYPVIYVGWNQARAYCEWLGKRLPTEAEWEYAARGYLAGNRYPWGNAITGTDANYWNSGDPEDNDTNAVGSYAANGYGLYDMAGNVWEWVEDDYHSNYTGAPTDGSAWVDTPRAPYRILRGGSWGYGASDQRVAKRAYGLGSGGLEHGFRCAR